MKVAAGMLHYRSWPEVCSTLDRLLEQTRPPDELLVVDHGSGDDSVDKLRAAYPDLELVEVKENRGPTAGMNHVLSNLLSKDADAIFILPDDLRLAPDALEHLAARLEEDPQLGAVGPLIGLAKEPERVFYAGGDLDRRTWDLNFRHRPDDMASWKGKPPHAIDFLELGGLLVRMDAARDAGPLDEDFYYWSDDVEYTLRIGARGWRLECVPAAVAWQDLGEPGPYIMVRNRLVLVARTASRWMLGRELLRVAYHLVRDAIKPGQRAELWPRFRGLIDFSRRRWGPTPASLQRRSES